MTKNKCDKYEKIKYLKTKELCSKNATIKDAGVENITAKNLVVTNNSSLNNVTANNLAANLATINNLQVTNLNGKNLACQETFKNINSSINTENPLVYPEGSGFNRTVWDRLAEETLRQQNELSERLQCGRLELKYIQDFYECKPCPPDELLKNCFPECHPPPPDGEACECPEPVGICPSVPLNIFGIKSTLPINKIICGPDVSTQLISSISYNLDVINTSGTFTTRVVTILVQAGYLDEKGNFIYTEIDFGNRQFGETLDTVYGEKYTGNVILDTNFMRQIASSPNTGALIQLVVFSEDGVAIDIRGQNKLSRGEINSKNTTSNGGPVDAQFFNDPNISLSVRAKVFAYYSIEQENLTSMSSIFSLIDSNDGTRWSMEWQFEGKGSGYFGIQTFKDKDKFRIIAVISDAAVNAIPVPSYVKATSVKNLWSLQVPEESISNFPINLKTKYMLEIKKSETTKWDIYISDISVPDNKVNLGSFILDSDKFIKKSDINQKTYYISGDDVDSCDKLPNFESLIEWTFPKLNDMSAVYKETPQNPCGSFEIKLIPDNSLSIKYNLTK